MQLENGTYRARPASGEGSASVYESQGGALMLAQKFTLDDNQVITAQTCLVNKAGAVMTRSVDDLKSLYGWNGVDPTWFMEPQTDLSGIEVDLVIENEEYEGKVYPKVKWVNKPGSGGGYKLPEGDKKTILAKYGSKFRALAGPQPSQTRTPPPPAVKPPARLSPAAAAAPAPARKASNQATAWSLFLRVTGFDYEHADATKKTEIEAAWYGMTDKVAADQNDITPDGWAKVEGFVVERYSTSGPKVDDENLPF
jgi:hypothetical protein